MRKVLVPAALAAVLVTPAVAQKIDARAMLVASTPSADSIIAVGTDTIELRFAEPAELLSVTLRLPDDGEMTAERDQDAKPGRQTQFRYRLPAPLEQPGNYSLSYLLVSKSFKSLNGFIDFRIEGETASQPAEDTPATETEEPE